MPNSEKFSPAGEFKKIEQERISSGMLAFYPELWGPIEEEKKEAILESATQAIHKALQEKDFPEQEALCALFEIILKRMACVIPILLTRERVGRLYIIWRQ